MKTFLGFFLVFCALVVANCPPGSTFVPNGNYYCSYDPSYVSPSNPSGFFCAAQGDCIQDCPNCLDQSCSCTEMAAIKPTTTTRVEKIGKGMRVTRLVIHTELKLKLGGPHIWMLQDPVSKKPVSISIPSTVTLSAGLKALLDKSEAAFAEQFKP